MKTALLLDDDAELLRVLALYLERQGFAVLPSASCVAAARQLENQNATIDLLLADVVMPGCSGVELAAQLVRAQTGLRIILMSGYPPEAWSERDQDLLKQFAPESVRVLLKPFSPSNLVHLLDELMGPGRRVSPAA